jgi:spore coat polysaccharide biosynthesis predicted glycosyltransferase SpsG
VLVSYGGTDPLDMTSKAIMVVGNAAVRHIQFDIVIGLTNPRRSLLEACAKHLPNASIHVDTPRMPELMASADLSLGAGGTTTWERMFMGLPSIVVSLAENQLETCQRLARKGLIRYLGFANHVTVEDLLEALLAAAEDHDWRAQVSARGELLVDGLGVIRILEAMTRISAPL